jgi:1-acyl-sn-glycerol-3-phosphate acyltransferase
MSKTPRPPGSGLRQKANGGGANAPDRFDRFRLRIRLPRRRKARAPADADALRASWAEGHKIHLTLAERGRIARRVALLALALTLGMPIHYLWRTVRYGSPIPRMFLRLAARTAGVRVTRSGTPVRRNVIYVANHLSWLDIPVIGGATGTAFVAKAELAKAPIVGWLARLNRTIFVERESRMAVATQIDTMQQAIADAWSVTIFPEGTTTDGQSLLPFKTAMLRVLEPPPEGMVVQPVLLDYGKMGEWIGWIGIEGGPNNAARIFARKGSFGCHVHFLPPFDPKDFPGRKAIAAECRRRIEAALTEALGAPPRAFAYDVAPIGYVAARDPKVATPPDAPAND